jgi:pimeloyl-ACP methyl ester carboxylesterase
MDTERIHRTVADDGTEIAARVRGQGPDLVLVHGGLGHGDVSFRFLIPLLAERFTCYSMSTRGRGLSGDHPDHTHERLVADVVAFVDSIGEPVNLMGHSSGGRIALDVVGQTTSVAALAVYEPWIPQLRDDEVAARNAHAAARIARLGAEARLAEAARVFFVDAALANDEELAVLAEHDVAELMAPTVPVSVQEMVVFLTSEPAPLAQLERATVPTLLLHGSRTHPFFTAVVHHLAARLEDATTCEIAGAGHLGPQLAPQQVAEALTHHLSAAPAHARAAGQA